MNQVGVRTGYGLVQLALTRSVHIIPLVLPRAAPALPSTSARCSSCWSCLTISRASRRDAHLEIL